MSLYERSSHIAALARNRLAGVAATNPRYEEICSEILLESSAEEFQWDQLVDRRLWAFAKQTFQAAEFSNFSLTINGGSNFLLDIYIWHERQTGIHDHNFAGAFQILRGKYLQKTFQHIPARRISLGWEEGELKGSGWSEINLFDVEQIPHSPAFIHQVSHLEDLCVTLCLRSPPTSNHLRIFTTDGTVIGGLPMPQGNFSKWNSLNDLVERGETVAAIELLKGESVGDIAMRLVSTLNRNLPRKWIELLPQAHPEHAHLFDGLSQRVNESGRTLAIRDAALKKFWSLTGNTES